MLFEEMKREMKGINVSADIPAQASGIADAACAGVQSRCGDCGAAIRGRHLGNVTIGDVDVQIGYCERCNAFTVVIDEDEKPYHVRMHEARRCVPKGWSTRTVDGMLELCEHMPLRWLWAFPVGILVMIICVWIVVATVTNLFRDPLYLPVFLAVLGVAAMIVLWGYALYRLTARRYRLCKDKLVVESFWLGLVPMCRRKFVRTVITRVGIEGNGKDLIAVWKNGYDRHVFWRGRSKDEADFIDANLLVSSESSLNAEPLCCGRCDEPFRSEDIDMNSNAIVCHKCGATTEPGDADYARCVGFQMKYRPPGLVDIPGGFEYRERKWWNMAVHAALLRYFVFTMIVCWVGGFCDTLSVLWGYGSSLSLLLLLVAAPVYLMVAAIVGRFGVHRITADDGHLSYYHGIGRWGRNVELPIEAIDGVYLRFHGSFLDTSVSVPTAIGIIVKGERRKKKIFRDCPPIFYHWAEGWLHKVREVNQRDTLIANKS